MGKLITRHIIDKYKGQESPKNLDKANKWWNLLWNWITKKLFTFNKEGFYEAAKKANAFETSAEIQETLRRRDLTFIYLKDLLKRLR